MKNTRKRAKIVAIKALRRMVYAKSIGDEWARAISDRLLRNECERLGSYGTLGADWWYRLFTEA